MKIASFLLDGHQTYGLVDAAVLRPVAAEFASQFPTLRALLEADQLALLPANCAPQSIPLSEVALLPPIPTPSKTLCVGLNYRKPYPVAGSELKSNDIVIFGRHDDTFVGPDAALEMPTGAAAESYDFEGEIVAVIGKTCRHVSEAEAMAHVIGYSCMNEGSVRGWQKHSVHAGKNFFASGSWGPWLTTADEAGSPETMELITRVNGEVMQQTTGKEMIHPLPKLISYLSHMTQLNPGDVIATGSPDGTGGSRTPPAFLKEGDVVEVEIPTIGTLQNPVSSSILF
ncbi:fumarylacetoacetate hydrolase family protein [Pseudophaeobacter sp.]|uniref:fumarylacetoacetate hydrolase family protein n=1 Tax=Pseudophaeobacter sp. TaxID=1971739 RepID=UPI00329A529E